MVSGEGTLCMIPEAIPVAEGEVGVVDLSRGSLLRMLLAPAVSRLVKPHLQLSLLTSVLEWWQSEFLQDLLPSLA